MIETNQSINPLALEIVRGAAPLHAAKACMHRSAASPQSRETPLAKQARGFKDDDGCRTAHLLRTCSLSSGLKARTPRMDSLLIDAMAVVVVVYVC